MAKQKSTNITWHGGKIGRPERQDLLRQRGATVWLTGLSGSGKSNLAASVETCEQRDPKGLYQKARNGEIPEFTGISAPYEAPENPELVLDADSMTIEEAVSRIIEYLEEKGYLSLETAPGATGGPQPETRTDR